MPTHEEEPDFLRDWASLSPAQKRRFLKTVNKMVEDVRAGRGFRNSLRVKGIQGSTNVFEMTWADDGRATFEYGRSPHPGDTHIVWRRIGGHDILKRP
jgi:hypothetical protein